MTERPSRSAAVLPLLVVLTAIVVLIGAWEVSRILNSRTDARQFTDRVTQEDVRENRRVIDELVCEVRALRRAAAAEGFQPDIPETQPRVTEELPCPPRR